MKKFFKTMIKVFKTIGDWAMFLMTGKGSVADEMIEMGYIDYSGQGRDKYGR